MPESTGNCPRGQACTKGQWAGLRSSAIPVAPIPCDRAHAHLPWQLGRRPLADRRGERGGTTARVELRRALARAIRGSVRSHRRPVRRQPDPGERARLSADPDHHHRAGSGVRRRARGVVRASAPPRRQRRIREARPLGHRRDGDRERHQDGLRRRLEPLAGRKAQDHGRRRRRQHQPRHLRIGDRRLRSG